MRYYTFMAFIFNSAHILKNIYFQGGSGNNIHTYGLEIPHTNLHAFVIFVTKLHMFDAKLPASIICVNAINGKQEMTRRVKLLTSTCNKNPGHLKIITFDKLMIFRCYDSIFHLQQMFFVILKDISCLVYLAKWRDMLVYID